MATFDEGGGVWSTFDVDQGLETSVWEEKEEYTSYVSYPQTGKVLNSSYVPNAPGPGKDYGNIGGSGETDSGGVVIPFTLDPAVAAPGVGYANIGGGGELQDQRYDPSKGSNGINKGLLIGAALLLMS